MIYFLFFLIGILGGCMVGPKYHKPDSEMPTSFEETKTEDLGSDEDLALWWKQFEDPLLDEMIEEAVQGNYDWRIAVEQIAQARAQCKVERSKLFPEIDINAAATRSRFSDNLFSSSSDVNTTSEGASPANVIEGNNFPVAGTIQNFFQIGFDAIWELDFFGKFRRGKQAAFDLWQASEESAKYVLISIISEVAKNYVYIRSLQRQIFLLQEKIKVDEQELFLAKILLDAGLDNQIQVEELIAILEKDKADLPVVETSFKQTVYALAVLLGKSPEGFIEKFAQEGEIPTGSGKIPAGLPSDLLRRRPDIKEAERKLAAATEKVGAAVADLFPHISITGNGYGYESAQINKWLIAPSRYWNIGPMINWNMIDFGRIRGEIAAKTSLQKQALLQYEQTVISALKDVEGSLVAYFEEQKRFLDYTTQEEANERSLKLTQDLFEAGLVDEMSVLSKKKSWIAAEQNLVQSKQQLTADLIAVYKALGGEWECFSSP